MVMQGYVDDSGNGDPDLFVLATLVARAESWATFSDEWKAVLDQAPKLEAFKVVDYFSGRIPQWRIDQFVGVINRHVEFGRAVIVKMPEFREIIKNQVTVALNEPVTMCVWGMISSCIAQLLQLNRQSPIDFIFDEMHPTTYLGILNQWRSHKNQFPKIYTDMMGSDPIMRDDKYFLPLQAADMFAGMLHRGCIDSDKDVPVVDSKAKPLIDRIKVPYEFSVWNRARMIEAKEWVINVTGPDVLYETKKERSKRLKEIRKEFIKPPKRP